MTLTSFFILVFVFTSLCGTTWRSADAVSLALRPPESPNLWGIANKSDSFGNERGTAQVIIAGTVRDAGEEYGHPSGLSRGDVSSSVYPTLVMFAMFLCFCPTSCYIAHQVRASARPRAREGEAARPTPRPSSSSSSSSNDRFAKRRRAPAPASARFCSQLTVPARSTLHCALQGTVPRQGQGGAVLVRSCADGTPLFRARAEGGDAAASHGVVIFLEAVDGKERFGSLSTKESGGPEPEMEIRRACGARFGSMRKDEKGGYVITSNAGAPVLSIGRPAQDLHVHGSGDHGLHANDSRAHDLHVHDSSGAAMAEVGPGSDEGTYEVKVNANGDIGLIILGVLAIQREEQIVFCPG